MNKKKQNVSLLFKKTELDLSQVPDNSLEQRKITSDTHIFNIATEFGKKYLNCFEIKDGWYEWKSK